MGRSSTGKLSNKRREQYLNKDREAGPVEGQCHHGLLVHVHDLVLGTCLGPGMTVVPLSISFSLLTLSSFWLRVVFAQLSISAGGPQLSV